MKFNSILLLAGAASALPADLEARQLSNTRTELERGSSSSCPDGILIFARATTEGGNIGSSTGPALAGSLEDEFSDFWVQGVGGPYAADTAGNFAPRGSPETAIREAVRLFTLANTKCPNTPVVAGGYSQGSALIAAAVSDLRGAVAEQVKGVVLFGYTKNRQNDERIPNYPTDRTEIFCNVGDLVCTGSLIIAAPHFAYTSDARGPAADFLEDQINSA